MGSFTDRLRHAWNAFTENESSRAWQDHGPAFYHRPDKRRLSFGNDRSLINAVLTRIANDAAALDIEHCYVDHNKRFMDYADSGLEYCLNVEANIDQSGRAFRLDMFLTMLDEGCIAIVPVDTNFDPHKGSFEIKTMRIGTITEWFPEYVRVKLYNEKTGQREEVTLPKRAVAIVENPFYSVMNEPNSTLRRLVRKMNLLDRVDEQIGSQKLDLIIQLPYTTKGVTRQKQAETRRQAIEEQLVGSEYGIAYIDGTERITQLNRPVENNLVSQVEYLTSMLYGQLGVTAEILNGTADEAAMNNYYARTIDPIISAPVEEMRRKFLTKTARSQGQSILYFRDPFKLMPTSSVAEIADKFTRNEIMTSNEIRQIVGMKPSMDPGADELRNKNLNQSAEAEEVDRLIAEQDGYYEEQDYEGY